MVHWGQNKHTVWVCEMDQRWKELAGDLSLVPEAMLIFKNKCSPLLSFAKISQDIQSEIKLFLVLWCYTIIRLTPEDQASAADSNQQDIRKPSEQEVERRLRVSEPWLPLQRTCTCFPTLLSQLPGICNSRSGISYPLLTFRALHNIHSAHTLMYTHVGRP